MPFTSLTFLLLFLPAVVALTALAGRWRLRTAVLLSASLLFYGWGEGPWLLVLVGTTALTWLLGLAIGHSTGRSRGLWLLAGVAGNVAVLATFKYVSFILSFLAPGVGPERVPTLPAALAHQPVGISFYTLQAIAYLVSVARDETPAARSPGRAGILIGLFPGLLAGPIVRSRVLDSQLDAARVTLQGLALGSRRFVIGLAKKVLLADVLGAAVEAATMRAATGLSPGLAWFALVAFTLQIYLDFSGYSDMAIGLARMLGLSYPENFAAPYRATSIAEFWSRWHISLSTWFRDLVFLPMTYGAARRLGRFSLSPRVEVLAAYAVGTVSTMALIGLWHGAAWHFVVWGLYFGCLLVLERTHVGTRFLRRLPPALKHAYVVGAVMLGWTIFRASSLAAVWQGLRALAFRVHDNPGQVFVVAGPNALLAVAVGILVVLGDAGLLASTAVRVRHAAASRPWLPVEFLAGTAQVVAVTLLLALSLVWLVGSTYRPFIYFQF